MSEVAITVGDRSIRTINQEIQAALDDGHSVRVKDPLSRQRRLLLRRTE